MLIYELAKQYDGKDRFYLEAIGIAVGHYDQARRDVILKDFDKEFPEWNDKVAGLVWELQPPAMMATLGKHLQDAKLPAEQRAKIIDILAASDDQEAGKTMLHVLQSDVPPEVRAKVLENLKLFLPNKWRDLRGSKELNATITELLAKADTRPTGLGLIAVAEKVELFGAVAALAQNADEPLPVRKAAIQTLGALPSSEAPKTLATLLTTKPESLRVDALQALGKLALLSKPQQAVADAALKVLKDVVGDTANDKEFRVEAVSALAGTRPGTEWLLGLHAKGQLDDAIKTETARMLRNSPYQDLQNKALLAFPPVKIDPKKMPQALACGSRRGDAQRVANRYSRPAPRTTSSA